MSELANEVTVDELVTLLVVLAGGAALLALIDPIANLLERIIDHFDPPLPDPYDPASHVRTLSACHTCGESAPAEDLRGYASSPLVDPEPTCPGCIEKAETEYEDAMRIASFNNHRERI